MAFGAAGAGAFRARRRMAFTRADQFARTEGFCHVVVAADLEA